MKTSPIRRPWWQRCLRGIGAVCLAATGLASPLMAADCYMKIEGIPGEVAIGRFKGWIQCNSVGHESKTTPNPDGGFINTQTFIVKKRIDKASPLLMKSCGDGAHFGRVTVAWVDADALFRVRFGDVLISSFQQAAQEGGPPADTVSFTYQKIEWTCAALDGAGSVNGGVTGLFDGGTQQGEVKIRPPFRASVERTPEGLLFTCPVEGGHRYRLLSTSSFGGVWDSRSEFIAEIDGEYRVLLPAQGGPALFFRLEEVE